MAVKKFRALARRLKDRIRCLYFARVFVNSYDLAKDRLVDGDVSISRGVASREGLPRWCADPELLLCADLVTQRLARGEICIASYDGERLVGYDW